MQIDLERHSMKEVFTSSAQIIVLCIAMVTILNSCDSGASKKSLEINQGEQDSLVVESETEIEKEPFSFPAPDSTSLTFHKQKIELSDTSFYLTLPEKWDITVAQEGFGRLRFLTKSPEGRLFVTDMKNRSDNSKGKVIVLDGFNKSKAVFDTTYTYLDRLRNPNNVTFHTDTNGVNWIYLALTQKLVRYNYQDGEVEPTSKEEIVAEFPDYGLSYKYGGWHLTRTVAIHDEKLYVSVGSSCNACEEKEAERASILEMDLDGRNVKHFAYGVRNAVDINWIHDELFSTNMGADHLGDEAPDEALYRLEQGSHYGWPYFYQHNGEIIPDSTQTWEHDSLRAEDVPMAFAELGGHSAPLGFDYFEGENWPVSIRNYFLVALHGSGHVRIGNGYNLVRVSEGAEPQPVISGWLQNGHRFGRPTDVFIYDQNSFFITDDHCGVLYYVTINETNS